MRARGLRRLVVVTPFVLGLGAGCASTNEGADDALAVVPPIATNIAPASGDPPPGDTDPCIVVPPPPGRGLGPGDLDPYFGCLGVASYGTSTLDYDIRALAIQSDDKIVAVGSSYAQGTADWDTWVARFDASGELDTTFGTNGVFSMNFTSPFGGSEAAAAVVVQSDGHIVFGGGFQSSSARKGFLVRLSAGGALDTGFGVGGAVVLDGMTYVRALALQTGDALGVVGESCPTDDQSCVATYGRFSGITGAPNLVFAPGTGGIASTLLGGSNGAHGYAVAPTSGDTVVIAGSTRNATTSIDVGLIKLAGNSVVTSFGTSGVKTFPVTGFQMGLGIVPIDTGYAIAEGAHTNDRFVVRRVNSVGATVATYGISGLASDGFDGAGATAFGLVAGPSGKVVAVGTALTTTGRNRMAVARFGSTGVLDPTFSDDGHAMLAAKGDHAGAFAVARQSTGKVIVGGWSFKDGAKKRAALVRLLY